MVRRIKILFDRPAMWIVEKFNSIFQRKAIISQHHSSSDDGQLAMTNKQQQQPYQHLQVKPFFNICVCIKLY